ncbi:hypothetical protein AQV86_02125 [Nanohaloarchaea archaeon SG9]|nr:hypothetical protein AQV86_02125 [Nanohaloarchaea archaeon SG9]
MKSLLFKAKDSKFLWYGITTVIFAGLIYFADVGDFVEAIRSIDPFYMFLAFISGMSFFLVFGYIYHSFFQQLGFNSSRMNSLKLFMAGNFMNSITPLGQLGGEPFMAYVVSSNTEATYEKSLSTVMSADIINAIPFVTYASAGIVYIILFSTITEAIKTGIYAVILLNILLVTTAYLAWFKTDKVEAKIHEALDYVGDKIKYTEKVVPPLKERITETRKAFQKAGEDRRHLLKVTLVTHIAPVVQLLSLYFILVGLGLNPHFVGIYFTVVLAAIAMFSPTPGGSGTFEAAFSGLLLAFFPETITAATAVAASVLFRLTTYWPGLLLGYLALLDLKRGRKTR